MNDKDAVRFLEKVVLGMFCGALAVGILVCLFSTRTEYLSADNGQTDIPTPSLAETLEMC